MLAGTNIVGRSVSSASLLNSHTAPPDLFYQPQYISNAHAMQASVLALLHSIAGAARGVDVHRLQALIPFETNRGCRYKLSPYSAHEYSVRYVKLINPHGKRHQRHRRHEFEKRTQIPGGNH